MLDGVGEALLHLGWFSFLYESIAVQTHLYKVEHLVCIRKMAIYVFFHIGIRILHSVARTAATFTQFSYLCALIWYKKCWINNAQRTMHRQPVSGVHYGETRCMKLYLSYCVWSGELKWTPSISEIKLPFSLNRKYMIYDQNFLVEIQQSEWRTLCKREEK